MKFCYVVHAVSFLFILEVFSQQKTEIEREKVLKPTLECKAGYFTFSGSKMRSIYTEGGIDAQLSAGYPFGDRFQLYASLEYLEKQGYSLHGHERTTVFLVPLSLGIKPIFQLGSNIEYYLCVGPRFFLIHQRNFSTFVEKNITDGGAGAFANTGLNLFFYKKFYFDVFAEYSYLRVNPQSSTQNVYARSIQVGGYTCGAGFGMKF